LIFLYANLLYSSLFLESLSLEYNEVHLYLWNIYFESKRWGSEFECALFSKNAQKYWNNYYCPINSFWNWHLKICRIPANSPDANWKSVNILKRNTVKLVFNEHSVITNRIFSPKLLFYYINQPGYNEPRLYRTNLVGPELFVITEFYYTLLVWKKYLFS